MVSMAPPLGKCGRRYGRQQREQAHCSIKSQFDSPKNRASTARCDLKVTARVACPPKFATHGNALRISLRTRRQKQTKRLANAQLSTFASCLPQLSFLLQIYEPQTSSPDRPRYCPGRATTSSLLAACWY